MPTQVSQSMLQRVREFAESQNTPFTVKDVTEALNIHNISAGVACRTLSSDGVLVREKVVTGRKGTPPYLYFLSTQALPVADAEIEESPVSNETPSMPAYRPNTAAMKVAQYLSRQDAGSQFTISAIRKQLNRVGSGDITREAVLMGVYKLRDAGFVSRTDKTRSSDGETYWKIDHKVEKPANAARAPRTTVRKTKESAPSSLEARVAELEAFVAKLRAVLS